MKNSLAHFLIVLVVLLTGQISAQQETSEISSTLVKPGDLQVLIGDWTGSLTYMDYSSNKPYTMPSNLLVKQGSNEYQIILQFSYPNEPKANSKEKISIAKDGKQLNKNMVKSRQEMSVGLVKITTENQGKDNNKKALIRNTYLLGTNQFIISKEVKFENSEEWLKRNEYSFER